MARPLLSAAMIVRDEERFLPDCLASLRGVADEVVVVDTGSEDRTVAIAEEAGARVSSFPWTGSFAAARNAALERARGRWILYIDADERVVGGMPEGLRDRFLEEDLIALTVRFRPAAGVTPYRENRLFRNDPRIRFRGVIHETQVPAVDALVREGGYRAGRCDLAIDHVGYDGPMDHKHRRNLPLLQARLETDPTHVYSWVHLGYTLAGLGRDEEAEAAWVRGLDVVRGKEITSTLDSLPYFALIRHRRGRGEDVSELLEEAWRLFPFHPEVRWLRARSLMDRGHYGEAAEILRALVETAVEETTGVVSSQMAHDERLFRVWAPETLGICCFRLGRYEESVRWLEVAQAAEPSRERTARLVVVRSRLREASTLRRC